MRPRGSPAELERRRARAIDLSCRKGIVLWMLLERLALIGVVFGGGTPPFKNRGLWGFGRSRLRAGRRGSVVRPKGSWSRSS